MTILNAKADTIGTRGSCSPDAITRCRRHPLSELGSLALGSLALGSLGFGSLGCASDGVDLGGGMLAQDLSGSSRCLDTTIVEDNVRVTTQEELAALEGCEEIRGDLNIQMFADADLAPLHALRVVEATLTIGSSTQDLLSSEQYSDQDLLQQIEDREAPLRGQWLASLAGLESLELIGSLHVFHTAITDLLPLARVRRIGGGVSAMTVWSAPPGDVYLYGNPRLEDLNGLDGASGVQQLQLVANASLQSLDGFAPEPVFQILNVGDCLALVNIDALANVTGIQMLNLDGTGLVDLDALSTLQDASDSLFVQNNPALVDASGLGNLVQSQSVLFSNNAALKVLPVFSNLSFIPDILTIRDNPELEELNLDFAFALPMSLDVGGELYSLGTDLINIGSNAKLRRVTFAPVSSEVVGLHAAQVVRLEQNPSLAQLDFGGLQRADLLYIAQNTALTEVILGDLATVDKLVVTNNPSLDASVFDPVRTFERTSSGNASEAAP
jgi:hypothetical protein